MKRFGILLCFCSFFLAASFLFSQPPENLTFVSRNSASQLANISRFSDIGAAAWENSSFSSPLDFLDFTNKETNADFHFSSGSLLRGQASDSVSSKDNKLIYWGKMNYRPPQKIGWVGYSNPSSTSSQTVLVPPAKMPEGSQTAGEDFSLAVDSDSQRTKLLTADSQDVVISSSTPYLSSENFLSNEKSGGILTEGDLANGIIISQGSSSIRMNPGGGTSANPSASSMSIPLTSGVSEISDSAAESPENWEMNAAEDENRLTDFALIPTADHSGIFRHAGFEMGYLPNVGDLKSGMTTLEADAAFAFPLFSPDHLLLVTPDFTWADFTLPEYLQADLGEKTGLYSPGLDFEYLGAFTECFLLDAAVKVHWNSDFKASSSKSLRVTGRAAGVWKLATTSRLILGASYEGLNKCKILPIAGVSWRPSDDCYVNLVFPNPKAAHRLSTWMKDDEKYRDYWAYLAGEFDGDKWTFRPDGNAVWKEGGLTYYDYRVLAGFERLKAGDINWAVEGGLVFGRKLWIDSYDSVYPFSEEANPKPTGVARLKVQF